MKLFFNREAEKSVVVRDHRELLLSIHGALAWVLHTQAEDGAGSGSITKAALHDEVKTYLETEEHDSHLAEELFKGTVERVGALVSRVEGTFEFEVQPLREYFAARHLYKTASHSPPGKSRKGMRPDRFQAIVRSFYWTNVTRFFCGFYDAGELGGLVDGITELDEQNGYTIINQPRRLAMMLLSDQVFSQSPRTMKRLIAFVADEPGFQRLTSAVTPHRRLDMGLPAKAGGDILFEACVKKLEKEDDPSRRRTLRKVMAENADRQKLKSIWTSRFNDDSTRCDPLREAMDFGIVTYFDPQEIARLVQKDVDSHLRWLILAAHWETIAKDVGLYKAAKESFFDGRLEFPFRWRSLANSVIALEALTVLLQPHTFAALFSERETAGPAYAVFGRGYAPGGQDLLKRVRQQYQNGGADSLESFTLFVAGLLSKVVDEWRQSLGPWSELVDRGLDEASGNYLMVRIAVTATVSEEKASAGVWDENGFAATKGLVSRLFFARHKGGDVNWWRARLAGITTETACQCLAVLLSWGSPAVISTLKADIDLTIKELSSPGWSRLYSMAGFISWAARERRATIQEDWFRAAGALSPRMALLLVGRVEDREVAQRLSRNYFSDCASNDEEILRHAAEIELFGSETVPIDWDHVRHLSKCAHQIGVRMLFPASESLPLKVPETVAKAVLSDCENHDGQLVAICEQGYATIVAQAAPKVSQVAETDGWFTLFD